MAFVILSTCTRHCAKCFTCIVLNLAAMQQSRLLPTKFYRWETEGSEMLKESSEVTKLAWRHDPNPNFVTPKFLLLSNANMFFFFLLAPASLDSSLTFLGLAAGCSDYCLFDLWPLPLCSFNFPCLAISSLWLSK